MLSILPQRLPQQIKFLYPYVQSLANPTRHAIVYTASNSKPFLASLSNFVIKSCEKWNHVPTLVSFWASITTEAVATMVGQARSARREAQRQNQEELLILVLPILSTALAIRNAPELRIGCYMVLTVLASRIRLKESVLTTMMKAVVSEWHMESHAGLICLSVLAQQRHPYRLPRRVLKALLSLPSLNTDLIALHEQYQVDRLVLGIIIGILKTVTKTGKVEGLPQIGGLLEAGLLREPSLNVAISSFLSSAAKSHVNEQQDHGSLNDLILRLADSEQIGSQVQCAISESKLELGQLKSSLHKTTEASETMTPTFEDTEPTDLDEQDNVEDFKAIVNIIPTKTASDISFLSHSESHIYDSLAQKFCSMPITYTNLARFSDLAVLNKLFAMTEPLFVSFYIRLWCSNSPILARAAALRTVAVYLKNATVTSDVQIMLPYLTYALSDPSSHVRSAAADLVLVMYSAYAKASEMKESQIDRLLLGHEKVYGQEQHPRRLSWLSFKESTRFMAELFVPHLEECVLDDQAVSRILSDGFNGHETSINTAKAHPELNKSLRLSMFSFLCSHTVNSPLYTFKIRMLRLLNNVGKVGSTTRTKLLLPLLSEAVDAGEEELQMICQREQIDIFDLLSELVGTVTPIDREGIHALRRIAESHGFEPLRSAAFQRIVAIWPQMQPDLQLSLAEMLLGLALHPHTNEGDEAQYTRATDALQSIQLSTEILQHFLNNLPTLSTRSKDKPRAAKRRRTDHSHSSTDMRLGKQNVNQDIRGITLVLELVNSSRSKPHTALLKGLFEVISDLKNAQDHLSTALGYLQILAMDNIHAIITKFNMSPDIPIDASLIRVDILVDYIRATSNPQVRNTALLLVASLADTAPELVLHSVMPIFTYMGANTLRQEDDFSTYVVQQTMDSVIPRLVQSLQGHSKHTFARVSELLLNFTAAFEHIPQQRRLDIFASLIGKIGADHYLFALLAILSDRYPSNKKALQLSMQLAGKFQLLFQLQTMEKYLKVVLDAWEPNFRELPSAVMLDQGHSAAAVTMNLLPVTIAVFRCKPLTLEMRTILTRQTADAVAVRASIANIFEHIFMLSQLCRNNSKLHLLCMQMTDSFLKSLPSHEMVHALEDLLDRGSEGLRRQVLLSFEHHLNSQRTDDQDSRESCLTFVSRLISLLQDSKDPLFKQSVVSAIDHISEKYGKLNPPILIEAALPISGDMCLGAGEASLRSASLLCLATITEVSGEMIVPVIPLVLPKVGNNLESSIYKDTQDPTLHNACYSVILALLTYVPWIITGADLDRILTLSHKSANAGMGAECDQTRIEILRSIAQQIDAKEVFAALDKTWPCAVIEGPKAVDEHFRVLYLTIDRQPKSVVLQQSEVLGSMILKAFDLRQTHSCSRTKDNYDNEEITGIEDAVNQIALAMIYKLNDSSFRPMFRQFMDWAVGTRSDSRGRIFRQITWYSFLYHFFDTFKSIVTGYAAFVIEDAVEVLQNVRPNDNDFIQLWRKVVQTLQKTCEHDQDGKIIFYRLTSSNEADDRLKTSTKLPLTSCQCRPL